MSVTLFHRTSIANARSIMKKGFVDRRWDLGPLETEKGGKVSVSGVWLSGRPLNISEGVEGDAQLEVTLNMEDSELEPFELVNFLSDARFWVAPAELINPKSNVRILDVDPKTSWFDNIWEAGHQEG